jgi:hypothetical protein
LDVLFGGGGGGQVEKEKKEKKEKKISRMAEGKGAVKSETGAGAGGQRTEQGEALAAGVVGNTHREQVCE